MHGKRIGLGFLLPSLGLVASSPAGAQAQDDFARDSAYLGVAGTFAIYTKVEDEIEDLVGSADVDEPLGLNARAGYRFHPHFAAEAEFEWLSEADVEISMAATPQREQSAG